MTEIVTTGTLTVTERVITRLQRKNKKYYIHGYSKMQFGMRHYFELGPFLTIKDALKDALQLEEANDALRSP
jgi:hypothetical protein